MIYELWETSSGNLIGSYDSESEALAVVRRVVEDEGAPALDSILLQRKDHDDGAKLIAEGKTLLSRASKRSAILPNP